MTYLATFLTHYGALCLQRKLKPLGQNPQMMPVPRSLSASCGVCIRFTGESPEAAEGSEDLEALYREENGGYVLLSRNG